MSTDSIADLLTRIRNASTAGHSSVVIPVSKVNKSILEVLKAEGFISGFETKEAKFPMFEVGLKYYEDKVPLLKELKRVSKPGCRVYKQVDELPRVHSGLGICVVSTSQGVMTDREARKRKIGGELLAIIG